MDFFDRQWSTYRAVVDHDLMQHRALTAALGQALETWVAARPAGSAPPRMVDLGCGDLAVMAPLLRHLPLGSYLGVDLSAPVLPRATAALGPVPYPCRWRKQDLLAWAEAEPGPEPVDLLHSAFAIHHLSDDDKARFLRLSRRHLAPQGLFLWVDVFRPPGEDRQSYVARYVGRIRSGWGGAGARAAAAGDRPPQPVRRPAGSGRHPGHRRSLRLALAGDLTKKKITSARFSKDKGGPALGLRQIGIREWNDDYITY
jgi:SAM-dependent methyltransferase